MTQEEQIIMLTQHDGDIKRHEGRIKELERRQDDLDSIVNAVAVMKADQDHIKTDVGEIKTKVNNLASIPAKRWESLIGQIITILVAALFGFLLSRIGL